MEQIRVIHGDCLEVLPTMPAVSSTDHDARLARFAGRFGEELRVVAGADLSDAEVEQLKAEILRDLAAKYPASALAERLAVLTGTD